MTDSMFAETKDLMVQRLAALRGYASRVVLRGESLTADEEADYAAGMRQFLATGGSFKLTEKEMVDLVLGDLFHQKRECGCHSCHTKQLA